VPFKKKPDGKFESYITFGMSYPRVGPVDLDGTGLMQALRKETLHRGARPVEHVMVTKIVWDGQKVQGAVGIDVHSGTPVLFRAKCIVLAAGSALAMYPSSSASFLTTGDAYRIGWELFLPFINMEFIEFTVIPAPRGIPFSTGGIKPTTSRGAKFYNRLGERFFTRYDPERLELTSRAKIVQAIYSEIQAGNGPCYLDATHLKEPTMPLRKMEQTFGIDWRTEKVPWVPAIHSFLGGVAVDVNGSTGIQGLYAAGESAGHGGVFGADRVAGAIAACQVLGHRAGKSAALKALETEMPSLSMAAGEDEARRWRSMIHPKGMKPSDLYRKLQQVSWDGVGVVRHDRGLRSALQQVEEIEQAAMAADGVQELVQALEVRNLALTAKLVATAALERKESRGEHKREDYPDKNDREWLRWVMLKRKGDAVAVETINIPFERYPLNPE